MTTCSANVQESFGEASWARVASFGMGMVFTYLGKLIEGTRYRAEAMGVTYSCNAWITQRIDRDVAGFNITAEARKFKVAKAGSSSATLLVGCIEFPSPAW